MSAKNRIRIKAADPAMVDRASEMDAKVKDMTADLDVLKDAIRREAGVALTLGINEVELEGDKCVVTIQYPRASYELDEGRIDELRKLLGSRFNEFVTERTTYGVSDTFEDRFEKLPSHIRTASAGLVIPKPATPRVIFGKIVRGP
jgi:hypothetical protein